MRTQETQRCCRSVPTEQVAIFLLVCKVSTSTTVPTRGPLIKLEDIWKTFAASGSKARWKKCVATLLAATLEAALEMAWRISNYLQKRAALHSSASGNVGPPRTLWLQGSWICLLFFVFYKDCLYWGQYLGAGTLLTLIYMFNWAIAIMRASSAQKYRSL